jgi:predicted N-acetyltransferase YhbS
MPSLSIQPATSGDADRVARLRSRCYRGSYADEPAMQKSGQGERNALEDVLVATLDGRDVATATSMRGRLNVRGKVVPCQGVAWVGTTLDARRQGGVASKVMWKMIEIARERGEVASALLPFRASYYETFGYGLCERRALWTVPTSILPREPVDSFCFVEPDDEAAVAKLSASRTSQFEHARLGHGDVAFPDADQAGMRHWVDYYADNGYVFADYRPDGSVRGWLGTRPVGKQGNAGLQAMHMIFDTPDGFMRQLHFLATLRDQYGHVEFATPADRPIHLLLRETQLPHRGVEHPHAEVVVAARNQVRLLDHVAVLDGLPILGEGSVVVRVHESEGHATTLQLSFADGRLAATMSDATPQFECADKVWAPIVLGELKAAWAATHGLATCDDASVLPLLDAFATGGLPFCREFF